MFRQALRLDPQLASSHFQLARVYQRENKYAEALTEIDAALKLDPDSPGIHYLRGQVLQRLGRTPGGEGRNENVYANVECRPRKTASGVGVRAGAESRAYARTSVADGGIDSLLSWYMTQIDCSALLFDWMAC